MTKAYILNFFKAHKDELREKYGLIKIGLFGSYAKGNVTEDSDIDLAIIEKKNFFIRNNLKDFLVESFNLPVDISYIR